MNENYLGNPNLKRSNVNINYTKEQLEEYIKCAKDPVYFIEEYIQIVKEETQKSMELQKQVLFN